MNEITLKISLMSDIYNQLLKVAEDSFVFLKTKDFDNQKENQLTEQRCFQDLLKERESVNQLLQQKAEEHGKESMKIRDFLQLLDGQEQAELSFHTENMLKAERAYRQQLKMNIEMANAIRDVHSMKIETAVEIAKQENADGAGPIMLDEDY